MKINTVIADFDRTLIYLYRDTSLLLSLAKNICELYSRRISVPHRFEKTDGYIAWHALHAKAETALDAAASSELNLDAERLVTEFEKKIVAVTPLFDGVAETVKLLHERGIRLDIVSNNADSAITLALEKAGIEKYFSTVIGRPYPFDPTKVKPSPYLINKIVDAAPLDRTKVLYIGDDVTDMQAATNANVLPVGVTTGRHSAEQLKAAGGAIVLNSFNELAALPCVCV